MKLIGILAILCGLVLNGCNSATTSDTKVNLNVDTSPEAQLKSLMADIEKSGEVGSGELIIQSELDRLKKSDASKATAIEGNIKELLTLKDSSKVKAKAAEISSQL